MRAGRPGPASICYFGISTAARSHNTLYCTVFPGNIPGEYLGIFNDFEKLRKKQLIIPPDPVSISLPDKSNQILYTNIVFPRIPRKVYASRVYSTAYSTA
eukprot:738896-Prorocentrum_minimum.AAC.1